MRELTTDEIAQGITRWACLSCGAGKESGKPLCIDCYRALPNAVKRKMFRRKMEEVAAGVRACLTWLAVRASENSVDGPGLPV